MNRPSELQSQARNNLQIQCSFHILPIANHSRKYLPSIIMHTVNSPPLRMLQENREHKRIVTSQVSRESPGYVPPSEGPWSHRKEKKKKILPSGAY